ncbi:UDP-N-acetylglucosamine transporter yea4 [Yarrowia sp. B02]|nr:UDP-N-acetylglucosamine transporter yea4 [Yarrowia sp. B02]
MDPKSQVTQRGGKRSTDPGADKKEDSGDTKTSSIIAASASISAAEWVGIATLIFGGCCSNVFTLEAIVKDIPDSGSLITFVQFLFVSIEGIFHFVDFSQPFFLRPSKAPYSRWAVSVLLFFLVSVINNYVWKLHISVPLHIIFRSGGTVITMLLGVLNGKRYTRGQVLSVAILTAGVILATFSQAPNKDSKQKATTGQFVLGIFLLLVAAVLSSFQGLFSEVTYSKYGGNWRESLFYTHFLSLPLFAPLASDIIRQFGSVWGAHPRLHFGAQGLDFHVSRAFMWLMLNATTQYLCIRGVNKLSGATSALTVGIVLNVRKFVSLLLSVVLFGNSLSSLTILGTVLLFLGAGLYSFEGRKAAERAKLAKGEKDK